MKILILTINSQDLYKEQNSQNDNDSQMIKQENNIIIQYLKAFW